MTVAARPSVIRYIENGTSTVFAVPFRFKSPAHLAVTRLKANGDAVTLKLGADYTVTGGETDAGGSVTLAVAGAGARLMIARATPRAQPMVYTTADRFPAKSHEAALDAATLMIQEDGDAIADLVRRVSLIERGNRRFVVLDAGVNPRSPVLLDSGRLSAKPLILDQGVH